MQDIFISAFAAYLLGSIPFGYLLYHFRAGEDIRTTGSGNIGATNVLRAAGWLDALFTFLLDAGKGYAAVLLAYRIASGWGAAVAAAILFVLAGHCYPVFLKFRGGKGVATGMGAFLAISPLAVLICVFLFTATLALGRYVSLASMVATAASPLALAASGVLYPPLLIASVGGTGLIIFRHRDNIRRLRRGTELRFVGRRKA
jgi:glycerol-3-phosphate acyltransferase PlsY